MKKNIRNRFAAVLLILCSFFMCIPGEKTYGASSYTNAKEFYESTGQIDGKHVDVYGGNIYFATRGRLASSSTYLLYASLGYDIVLTGNGKSISFSVSRREGGSMVQIESAQVNDGEYLYNLLYIPTEKIRSLARATNNPNVETVLSADVISVQMDAIMTTQQNGVTHGWIEEDGKGGVRVTRTPVYHLNNSADLKEMKKTFNDEFNSFRNIRAVMDNFQLDIAYQLGEFTSINSNYKGVTGTLDGITYKNILYNLTTKKVELDSYKIVQSFTLKNPASLELKKTGYHLPAGAEWKDGRGVTFSSTTSYQPTDISMNIANDDDSIVLMANWKPNPYTISYNANGGQGTISATSMTYDKTEKLQVNTFTRTGYRLKEGAEWNTKPDGIGTSYASGADVLNLTSQQNGQVTLYANWEPCVYEITTDKHGGTGGTDTFYEKYDTGFYSTNACASAIRSILFPARTGYTFLGYFTSMNGKGNLIVNNAGFIDVPNNFFNRNARIHANWMANTYTVTFDKQGGEYGSDTALATYDQPFPVADAPKRNGYTFKGYYTEENGGGMQIYNENMASDIIYQYTSGVTLYAYWVDDILPQVELTVDISGWTNQEVTLTATASDYGVGLKSLVIYKVSEDGTLSPVASAPSLNGAKTKTLTFTNPSEGVHRYKAVVTDVNECTAESYNAVYYDVTAPTGSNVEVEVKDHVFTIEVDISDINKGD